jgi:uncharacterized protein (DUF2141 family)
MNKTILTLALLFTAFFCNAQDTYTLTVEVPNAASDEGMMVIGLYTEAQFMRAAPETDANVKIKDGKAVAELKNVKPGTYAVMVLHDKNGNNQMDFESNGMPKEAYGMSNNPMSYGPPQFSDAAIEVKEDQKIVIRL